MRVRLLMLASMVLFALSASAQEAKQRIFAEGGGLDDRASARVLYWDQKADAAAGQVAINYGRPVWKPVYEDPGKFDALTKGKIWRMGSNFWTTLVTDLRLDVGGRRVTPGAYYLGIKRSSDGSKWSLAFIDPATVRKMHLDAFDVRKAPVRFEAPLTQEAPSGDKAQKLTVTLSYPKNDIKNLTLKVAWGNLQLTTPIKVELTD